VQERFRYNLAVCGIPPILRLRLLESDRPMAPRYYLLAGLMAWITLTGESPGQTQEKLDPEALKAALRTTTIEEHDYIPFLVTLVDQERLPRVMIDTAFHWARNKTYRQYQFFKRAVIAQAGRAGITLPTDTPPLEVNLHGRVVQRVGLVDIPLPFIGIDIEGTEIRTRTNIKGEFTLTNLGWGAYKIRAHGGATQLFRTISARVMLPFLPNDVTTLTLKFR
jgi:hypothetical protein